MGTCLPLFSRGMAYARRDSEISAREASLRPAEERLKALEQKRALLDEKEEELNRRKELLAAGSDDLEKQLIEANDKCADDTLALEMASAEVEKR